MQLIWLQDAWYEVDDLRVTDMLSQMVVLSETYMQIYELKRPSPKGT